MACDEQIVLLVDGYDAAWSPSASAREASGAGPAELLDRVLFDAIAAAGHSLRLTCLMGERPGPAEVALSLRGYSYCLSTPLSTWCDRWFGFSDAEVEALLNHAGHEEHLDDAREWLGISVWQGLLLESGACDRFSGPRLHGACACRSVWVCRLPK